MQAVSTQTASINNTCAVLRDRLGSNPPGRCRAIHCRNGVGWRGSVRGGVVGRGFKRRLNRFRSLNIHSSTTARTQDRIIIIGAAAS